ncbi:type II secretion system F family protein [Mycoplasmatota bacterium WC44]
MIKDFKYTATTRDGKKIKGTMEAPNKKVLAEFLFEKGLTIISLDEYSNIFTKLSKITLGKTIKEEELIFILQQLSAMLKAKMRVVDALEVLASQTSQKIVRRILYDIFFMVQSGMYLSDAMGKYPHDFPKILINMLRNGELQGDLVSVLDNVESYYSSNKELKSDILGAITMPALYLGLGIAVSIGMITFVLPNYLDLFTSLDAELPKATKMLLDISDFLTANWNSLLLGIVVFIALFYIIFFKYEKGKYWFSYALIRAPFLGKITIMYNLSNISSTLSQMVVNHVNLLDGLTATRNIINNQVYKSVLDKVLVNITNGYSISRAMENHFAFTDIFVKMITLGEKSGNLDDMLLNLSQFYSKDVKIKVKKLRKRIEPTMMMFIYALVGGLVMAVMLPSFELMNAI